MSITRDEVLKIAELARLHFTEAELQAFTLQFQRILDYIEKLREVDLDGVPPTSHVSLVEGFEKHLFREDQPLKSLSAEDALANAPDVREDQFRVPKAF